jgi:hypothetical protein
MRTGESQYHLRLAARLLEDGPITYSQWIDKLSMHPSTSTPGAAQPPGTHLLAASVLAVERIFSRSSRVMFYFAPAMHCILAALMYNSPRCCLHLVSSNCFLHVLHHSETVALASSSICLSCRVRCSARPPSALLSRIALTARAGACSRGIGGAGIFAPDGTPDGTQRRVFGTGARVGFCDMRDFCFHHLLDIDIFLARCVLLQG